MKKITVLILTYNHSKFIEKSLESVLKQKTNYDYEILVGDDSSPDNTAQILKTYREKYPDKINLILREKNIGVRENFLDLLTKAKGEYIALLEGDDYWISDNKLDEIIYFLENNKKDYIGGFHNIQVVDLEDNLSKETPFKKNLKFSDINSLNEHYQNKIMMTLSMVFRNIFLEEENLQEYREMLHGIKYACDYNLKSYLLSYGKFKYFDNIFGGYRFVNSGGSSWSSQPQLIKNEDFLLINKINLKKYRGVAEKYLGAGYLFLFLKTLAISIRKSDFEIFFKILREFDYKIFLSKYFYLDILKKIFMRIKNDE